MRRLLALAVIISLWPGVGRAEPVQHAEEVRPSESPSTEAARHFTAALEFYRTGKYERAISELEQAYGLDPTGKDLVYNLAVVSEKLGELDDAIHYFQRYLELETDPKELEHARAAITRLEGARAELSRRAPAPAKAPPPPPAKPMPAPSAGKLDGWVIATGGVAVASLIVGSVFGIKALVAEPDGATTGPDQSIGELEERASDARDFARIADVAFAVSLVSGATAGVLYFGRSTTDAPQCATVQLSGTF